MRNEGAVVQKKKLFRWMRGKLFCEMVKGAGGAG